MSRKKKKLKSVGLLLWYVLKLALRLPQGGVSRHEHGHIYIHIAIFGWDNITLSVSEWHQSGFEGSGLCFCRGGTLVLGRGASGLRTGPLFAFPEELLRGTDFLLDVILSRMLDIRGWLDEDKPWTWIGSTAKKKLQWIKVEVVRKKKTKLTNFT